MQKSIYIGVLLGYIWLSMTYAQSSLLALPKGVFSYQFEEVKADENFHGYFLLSPFLLNAPADSPNFIVPKPLILDKRGSLVWFVPNATGKMNSDFKYFPHKQQFTWMHTAKNGNIFYLILDKHLQIVDTLFNSEGVLGDGHELIILANGNYLIGGRKYHTYHTQKNEFVSEMSDNEIKVKATSYIIEEFDRNKKRVFQWDSHDFLSPKDFVDAYNFNAKEFDYCHANAIYPDKDGNLVVSFRNFDAIYKIEKTTGKVLWKLGGKSNQFSFVNDAGFSGQHYVRVLPNGNISLYDNATNAAEPKTSRGVEYALDLEKMTASKVSEAKENVFGKSLGSYQQYQGKYHLINYGFVFQPSHNITLMNANKEVLAHIRFKDSVMNYRAEIADIEHLLPRHRIKMRKVKQGFELSAPANCKEYLWSNGERSRKIIVTQKGEYQVWIPFGVGMLASYPYQIP